MKSKRGKRGTPSEGSGATDWKRLKAMRDSNVRYTRDSPRTLPEDWARAVAHRGLPVPPRKRQIALRVDVDVLEWFKAQGDGYQTRMNAVLREFRDAHLATHARAK